MPYVTIEDGAGIFYNDWRDGQPTVLCHGWTLNADSWEYQMLHLASHGFRCVAHDRRGHRPIDPDLDGQRDGHVRGRPFGTDRRARSAGRDARRFLDGRWRGRRYIGRHGTERVARVVLVSAVPPLMFQRPDNPGGVPVPAFDELREASLADRSQL